MDNVRFFNDPNPSPSMNIVMLGQQMEQQSVFSESRPISRSRQFKSKGTMSTFSADKPVYSPDVVSDQPFFRMGGNKKAIAISASQY